MADPPLGALLGHLERLVACDTTSRESNLPVLDHVEEVVDGTATLVRRVPDETGTKANLVVRFGPDAPGGVVLSAHTDCVPVDGQAWSSDPFTLTHVDDRVVARGAVDMKGFVAACLDLVPVLADTRLARPVWFAFSYDEELGALGARSLVPAMVDLGAAPDAVVVGEPTSLEIVNAHKSVRAFTLTFTGRSVHSSRPSDGANAAVAAARVAARVGDLADELVGDVDLAFDPPHTTCNVGMIGGGTAINIVPDRASVTWEYRALPSEDGPELAEVVEAFARQELERLRATAPESTLEVTCPGVLPALQPELDGTAERLVRSVTGSTIPASAAPFGTDGARFQRVGWSTVVCGPGAIDVAHRPDEWIALEQLAACRQLLRGLVQAQTVIARGSKP